MFSGSSFASTMNAGPGQDTRPSYAHAHSHSLHQGSTFSVAGMSNAGMSHSPSLRGSSMGSGSFGMGSSLSDGFAQSRSHYQPGYLMSVAQNNASPQGSQRHEDVPIVQTKAKLNHVLGHSADDFGMDSMFENSRQRHRQTLDDEDAPPMNSVNDIVDDPYSEFIPSRSSRDTTRDPASSRLRSSHPSTPKPAPTPVPAPSQIYVLVFGYPPDKYSVTAEYFRSLGAGADPEAHTEITNCFRIGYTRPIDAFRAVRKNGEVLSGWWMVGAKWADVAQAEKLLGPALLYGPEYAAAAEAGEPGASPQFGASRMSVDELESTPSPTPAVGTPLRLAPSAAAFRRPGALGTPVQKAGTPQGMVGGLVLPAGGPSPSKGVLEQVSDLIFGW